MTSKQIIEKLSKSGFEVFIVGGFVRDQLMGFDKSSDIDIVTSAKPDEIIDLFQEQNVKLVGKNFGVVIVDNIEVATYRIDKSFGLSDKNTEIKFANTIEEDLSRRDLTINSIALDPFSEKIVDPFNGVKDLKDKIIRFTGDPFKRIYEDPNRIIRACRFLALIDGKFDKNTKDEMKNYSDYVLNYVNPERIRLEVLKSMKIQKASLFFNCLYEINCLQYIFPSLETCYNFKNGHGKYHIESIIDHSLICGDNITTKYPLLKLTGYLHDVGKPISADINKDGQLKFLGHEKTGAKVVEDELKNLTFSNYEIDYIKNLIYFHMRIPYQTLAKPLKKSRRTKIISEKRYNRRNRIVRRFLKKINDKDVNYKDLVRLMIADRIANISKNNYTFFQKKLIMTIFKNVLNEKPPNKFSDLKINGNDIMEIRNLKPSPEVGRIKKQLLQMIVNDLSLNEKETLEKLVKEIEGKKK